MKELGIVVLGIIGGILLGVLIGSHNKVSKEKHHEVCQKYDAEIQNYHDYIIAIEKYDVIDSIKKKFPEDWSTSAHCLSMRISWRNSSLNTTP